MKDTDLEFGRRVPYAAGSILTKNHNILFFILEAIIMN